MSRRANCQTGIDSMGVDRSTTSRTRQRLAVLVAVPLLTVTGCTSGGSHADNLGDAFKNCDMGDGSTVGSDATILISDNPDLLIAHSIDEGTCALEQVDAPEEFVRTIRQGTVADVALNVQWGRGWSAEYIYPQGSDRGQLTITQSQADSTAASQAGQTSDLAAAPVQETIQPPPEAGSEQTIRDLVDEFVFPVDRPDGGPAQVLLHVTDVARARAVVDTSGARAEAPQELRELSGMSLTDPRLTACVPIWFGWSERMGWEPYDADALVTTEGCQASKIYGNTLLRGGAVSAPPDSVSMLDERLWSAGSGEDFSAAAIVKGENDLSGIGSPTRIAHHGDSMFVTGSTKEARAWLAGEAGADAAAKSALLSMAGIMDGHGVFSAVLASAEDPLGDLRESRAQNRDQMMTDRVPRIVITEACDWVGVGYADSGSGTNLTTVLVYAFPDEDTAGQALPQVERAWDLASATDDRGVALTDLGIKQVQDVTHEDQFVVVTLDAGTGGRSLAEDGLGTRAPLACLGSQ